MTYGCRGSGTAANPYDSATCRRRLRHASRRRREPPPEAPPQGRRRVALNTAIFSLPPASRASPGWGARSSPRATSRPAAPSRPSRSPSRSPTWCAALVRRRGALGAAFVPVFTELLEQKPQARGPPARLARCSSLILAGLGALTALFILLAPADHAALHRRQVQRRARRPDGRARRGSCSRSSCCSASTGSWSGSSTPTTTSRSRRSRRWCGTS